MKRGFVNSRQPNGSFKDSNSNCRLHSLVDDYLDLQKKNEQKKRKIRAAKQKVETLRDEVRFMRQRYEYLINSQLSDGSSPMGNPSTCPPQIADINVSVRKEKNNDVNEANMKQEGEGKEDRALKKPTIENNKPTDCLISERQVSCSAQKKSVHT